MHRSNSIATDVSKKADLEELKELFPAPIDSSKKGDPEKESNFCTCAKSHKCVVATKEVSEPSLKVVEAPISITGNALMTRRITIAGGFLDIALFTANCEQLKFVLELGTLHIYYDHVLGLIITSLVLQLLVGLTMFLLGCNVSNKLADVPYSNFLNHVTMGLVAAITIVNVFISTFGPKGTVMARCLGAFSYPNTNGPVWMSYLNATRAYMMGNFSS